MAVEIERKFLVVGDNWRDAVDRSLRLRDGLLAFHDGRKIRIRFYDDRATLTVKGPRRGITRDEFEYEIPASDGLALLERHCKGEVLDKTRHHVRVGALEWSIDEYHGFLDGVILAEVELPRVDVQPELPAWAGKEVTGLERYRKVNMIKAKKKKLADAARRMRGK